MRKNPIDQWRHMTDNVAIAGAVTLPLNVKSRESVKLKYAVVSSPQIGVRIEIRINGITHYWEEGSGVIYSTVKYEPPDGHIVKANSVVQVIGTNVGAAPADIHVSVLYDRIGY